ncbi:MAG: Ivy family c-type lysozyme inhibitor [Caldimonas sp.]
MNPSPLIGAAILAAAVFLAPPASAGDNAQKTFKGYALHDLGASGLLYDPKAKAIYYKALGPLAKQPWLAKLDGPSPQNRPIKVAGADYVLVSWCKNHDCEQNSAVLLWSGAQDVVYGKVYQKGKSTFIGAPPAALEAELDKLWKAEWRSPAK